MSNRDTGAALLYSPISCFGVPLSLCISTGRIQTNSVKFMFVCVLLTHRSTFLS